MVCIFRNIWFRGIWHAIEWEREQILVNQSYKVETAVGYQGAKPVQIERLKAAERENAGYHANERTAD